MVPPAERRRGRTRGWRAPGASAYKEQDRTARVYRLLDGVILRLA